MVNYNNFICHSDFLVVVSVKDTPSLTEWVHILVGRRSWVSDHLPTVGFGFRWILRTEWLLLEIPYSQVILNPPKQASRVFKFEPLALGQSLVAFPGVVNDIPVLWLVCSSRILTHSLIVCLLKSPKSDHHPRVLQYIQQHVHIIPGMKYPNYAKPCQAP